MLNLISHPSSSGRQKLFYMIMILVAYATTVGYGVFLYFASSSSLLPLIAGTAFFVFVGLGFSYNFTGNMVLLYRIGIVTVAVAFTALTMLTGGAESPAFLHLLITSILSFFYKPVKDRYIFTALTIALGIAIIVMSLTDVFIVNTIYPEYQQLFAVSAHLYFGAVFFSFIYIFSFAVRHINRKLTDSYDELKAATQKLVESEKMASLGQLMAGLAHEINNPVNYIKGCSTELERLMIDLKRIFGEYEAAEAKLKNAGDSKVFADTYREEIAAINKVKQEVQFEVIWDLGEELLASIQEGTDRTAEIIKSLSFYSRDHKRQYSTFDLNETIRTTLKIISQKVKKGVEIVTDYGKIPAVFGSEGRISQVVLNLVVNAIDACGDEGRVEIQTRYDDGSDHLIMQVKDTGTGVPRDLQQKVFDPFFTTKEVGKGTGLGLSISKEIIEKHDGSINLLTSDKGTIFTVLIPVADNEKESLLEKRISDSAS